MAFSADSGPASQGSQQVSLHDPLQDSLQDALQDYWRSAWPSLVRIVVVEILALLVLASALVYYLNWSSEVSVAEFMAASKTPHAADAPLRPTKSGMKCERGA